MAKVWNADALSLGPMPAWSITELGLSLVPNHGRNSDSEQHQRRRRSRRTRPA